MSILTRFRGYVAAVAFFLTIVSTATAKYDGGSGTRNDPYQIWTAERMNDPQIGPTAWHYVLRGGCWASLEHEFTDCYRYGVASRLRIPGTRLSWFVDRDSIHDGRSTIHDLVGGLLVCSESNTSTGATQARPKARDGEPSILTAGGVTFKFIPIPPGEFLMGSEKGRPDEKPIHRVRIPKNLEITRTEVTVGQFRAFVEATGYRTRAEIDGGSNICNDKGEWPFVSGASWRQPGYEQSDDCPVVCVNWHDATAFCAWLSKETGEQCRLSAEAEWEYTCRAGDVREDKERLSLMAWYGPNAGGRPHPVAWKTPNAWGLYDMHGNVSEWCLDIYHKSYADAPDDGSAWLTKGDDYAYYQGENRVVRGATWITDDPGKLRPTFRRALRPTAHDNLVGFRVVHVRLTVDANGL